ERRGDGDGGDVMVASVGRQLVEGAARGGECYRGSSRSVEEEHLWCWPENSPENFAGGGWPEKVAAGGGRWWPDILEMGECIIRECVYNLRWK
ncbi:hypothetical protein Tco_0918284, partial [Tanacetum coccineum]